MAALFALVGTLATVLTTNPDLDRGALARLAAEAALDGREKPALRRRAASHR